MATKKTAAKPAKPAKADKGSPIVARNIDKALDACNMARDRVLTSPGIPSAILNKLGAARDALEGAKKLTADYQVDPSKGGR